MKEFLTPHIEKFLTYGGQYLTLYLLGAVILLFVLFLGYYLLRTSMMRFTIRRARKKFTEDLMSKKPPAAALLGTLCQYFHPG